MTRWKIHPGADNESTIGFQIYTTKHRNDPKTMMLQIADTGTIGLGTPPTDGVRLKVDGKVTATTFNGDGGPLTVGGQELAQTLADLRADVDASAPLSGAPFRGAVTAPSFSGDGEGSRWVARDSPRRWRVSGRTWRPAPLWPERRFVGRSRRRPSAATGEGSPWVARRSPRRWRTSGGT